ncbi:MAG: PadR family transcriptional regulator [bacterium]
MHVVDVMQGTLPVLILKALSLESMHGWGISEQVARLSGGAFQVGQGSLYPALHRFESNGWVLSHWRTTENNRLARYYQLTPVGRKALSDEVQAWRYYADAMQRVVESD